MGTTSIANNPPRPNILRRGGGDGPGRFAKPEDVRVSPYITDNNGDSDFARNRDKADFFANPGCAARKCRFAKIANLLDLESAGWAVEKGVVFANRGDRERSREVCETKISW
jgi:hypothetical protein